MAGLVSVDDLKTLMKVDFAGDELEQAELVLTIVSSWARVVSGQQWPDAPAGVPDDVRAVVLQASRRELKNPDRVISRQMGPFNVSYSSPPDGFFYPGEMAILRRFRRSGGLRVLATGRSEQACPDVGYLRHGEGGDLFPVFSECDPGFSESIRVP